MTSMVEATERFIAASPWLTDEDAPAVALLRVTAKQLDGGYQPSTAAVYAQTHRALLKKAPAAAPVVDDDEAFLTTNAR